MYVYSAVCYFFVSFEKKKPAAAVVNFPTKFFLNYFQLNRCETARD